MGADWLAAHKPIRPESMSTNAEKVEAQRQAFNHKATFGWHRHLIGPQELERLLKMESKLVEMMEKEFYLGPNSPQRMD